jgi:uncharacterized membrane protein YhaH (DUF805 family)
VAPDAYGQTAYAPVTSAPAAYAADVEQSYQGLRSTQLYSQRSSWQEPVANRPTELWEPLYGASAGQAFSRFWRKYADFTGRASRSEFWWAYLWTVLLGVVSYVVFLMIGLWGATAVDGGRTSSGLTAVGGILLLIWFVAYLGMIVPCISVAVRRLHDAGVSGLFYLLAFVPFGSLVLLYFWVRDSSPEGAKFDRPR